MAGDRDITNEELELDAKHYSYLVSLKAQGFNKVGDDAVLYAVGSLPLGREFEGYSDFGEHLLESTSGATVHDRKSFLNSVSRFITNGAGADATEKYAEQLKLINKEIKRYDRFEKMNIDSVDKMFEIEIEESLTFTRRKDYNDTIESLKDHIEDPFKDFLRVYGPNGKMPEELRFADKEAYDNLALPVPEGLDELTVTAIMIGACMDPSRLNKGMSSSSFYGEIVTNNQMHFMSDIPEPGSDQRDARFAPVMMEARKDALHALELYAQGDPTEVKRMLKTFIAYEQEELCTTGRTIR